MCCTRRYSFASLYYVSSPTNDITSFPNCNLLLFPLRWAIFFKLKPSYGICLQAQGLFCGRELAAALSVSLHQSISVRCRACALHSSATRMVSSQSSAAPNPPLSYADRAKKAQNTRPKAQPQAGPQGIALPSSSSASTSTPHPGPSTAANASMNVARTARADGNSAPSALSSVKSISGPSSPSRSSANVNGDVSSTARDSVVSQPQPQGDVTVKSTAAPAVNVWSLRKEQMARVRSSQGTTASVPVQNSPSPHQADNETLEEVASSSNALQNVTNQRPSTNVPGRSPANGEDDAFVVRPRASILPPSEDTESWPEVGKSVSHTSTGSGQAESEPAGQGHERDASREGSQGQGPSRKSASFYLCTPHLVHLQRSLEAMGHCLGVLTDGC